MDWKDPQIVPIPPRKQILVVTDLGEPFIAWRNKKNSAALDVKCCINGKVEWTKNALKLKYKMSKQTYCPIAYWLNVPNLTKSQFKAKYEMHPAWNKMFER